MPILAPAMTGTILAGLTAAGMTGQSTSTLASGVAKGVVPWAKSLQVVTVDTGSAGVGTGIAPFVFPSPLLITNLLTTYAANGLIGPMAPLEATGLGNGLGLGFIQGFIRTNHPSVGTGAGVAKVIPTPAFPYLMQGFASVQIKGAAAAKKANAISQALTMTLAVFTLPVAIVGAPLPSPGAGVGVGSIV